MTTTNPDIERRRKVRIRHIGEQVELRRQYARKQPSSVVKLVDIKRTRALVEFPNAPLVKVRSPGRFAYVTSLRPEQWTVPLDWLLIPGSLEPDARQLPLIVEVA